LYLKSDLDKTESVKDGSSPTINESIAILQRRGYGNQHSLARRFVNQLSTSVTKFKGLEEVEYPASSLGTHRS